MLKFVSQQLEIDLGKLPNDQLNEIRIRLKSKSKLNILKLLSKYLLK